MIIKLGVAFTSVDSAFIQSIKRLFHSFITLELLYLQPFIHVRTCGLQHRGQLDTNADVVFNNV